jgi:hypothetical protein
LIIFIGDLDYYIFIDSEQNSIFLCTFSINSNKTDRLNYKITIMYYGDKKRRFIKGSGKGPENK